MGQSIHEWTKSIIEYFVPYRIAGKYICLKNPICKEGWHVSVLKWFYIILQSYLNYRHQLEWFEKGIKTVLYL